MMIFTGAQFLFVIVIAWNFLVPKREDADQASKRRQNLVRMAPLLICASIMISVYYFGKEFLAEFNLPRLRPIMMSAFLQLLAILAFDALFRTPLRLIQRAG
jgi:hypothetical protein